MENVDVSDLSDEQLKQLLVKYGYIPGPIVKTTRSVYEKKLIKLLQERNVSPQPPTAIDDDERFSHARESTPNPNDDDDDDRLEGEESFRFVSPVYQEDVGAKSSFLNDSGKRYEEPSTEVRYRLPQGVGATPLIAKTTHLPGHSLRPWLSETTTPKNITSASVSSPVAPRAVYGSKVDKRIDDTTVQRSGLPIWLIVVIVLILAVFFYMFGRRILSELELRDKPELE